MAESERGTKGIGEAYGSIVEVIEDCRTGKRVYLRHYLTAADVVLNLSVMAVLELVKRGQLKRVMI